MAKPKKIQKRRCPSCDCTQVIGVEVQGEYDGVLFWHCRKCKTSWPRWFENKRLWIKSRQAAADSNQHYLKELLEAQEAANENAGRPA